MVIFKLSFVDGEFGVRVIGDRCHSWGANPAGGGHGAVSSWIPSWLWGASISTEQGNAWAGGSSALESLLNDSLECTTEK